MMLVHVARARHVVQHGLALLLVVGAGRFAYVSYERWSALQGDGSARAQDRDPRPPLPEPAPTPAAAGAAAPEPPLGELITIVLSVSHGNHRSEVFFDDSPLGHTAYVGQVPCRRGSEVRIRIHPKRASPIEHVRRCDGSDISIQERP